MASIARLVLNGEGNITGVASVNFNGLFLGNPVTGTYEVKPDCTMTWSLQDDSGAWQHFSGKAAPDGGRVEFHQTDPGTGGRGVIERAPAACNTASFRGHFTVTIAGDATPLALEGVAPKVSAKGEADADGAGNLAFTWGGTRTGGSYSVDSDCFADLVFGLPAGGGESSDLVNLRGIVVNGGREVLAVQTDPERVAGARFLAK